MKAIMIDPFTQTIEEVEYSGNYKDLYDLLGCHLFTTVYLDDMNLDTLYVDDEGLYVENQMFFKIAGFPQPLAGRGILLGTDDEGDSISCESTVEGIKALVEWCGEGVDAEASFIVMAFNEMKNYVGADEMSDKELVDLLIGEDRELN